MISMTTIAASSIVFVQTQQRPLQPNTQARKLQITSSARNLARQIASTQARGLPKWPNNIHTRQKIPKSKKRRIVVRSKKQTFSITRGGKIARRGRAMKKRRTTHKQLRRSKLCSHQTTDRISRTSGGSSCVYARTQPCESSSPHVTLWKAVLNERQQCALRAPARPGSRGRTCPKARGKKVPMTVLGKFSESKLPWTERPGGVSNREALVGDALTRAQRLLSQSPIPLGSLLSSKLSTLSSNASSPAHWVMYARHRHACRHPGMLTASPLGARPHFTKGRSASSSATG